MLSHRADEIAILRQLGLISNDELGVRAGSKVKKTQPGQGVCWRAGNRGYEHYLPNSEQMK